MSHRYLFTLLFASTSAFGAPDLSGVWTGTMKAPDMPGPGQGMYMVLKHEGATITGTLGPRTDEALILQKAALEGKIFSFEINIHNERLLKFRLELAGDAAMSGTFSGNRGAATIGGTVELKRGVAGGPAAAPLREVKPYDDVRGLPGKAPSKDFRQLDAAALAALIPTLTFNQTTQWPEASRMPPTPRPADLIAASVDPGLGVRELHGQGITGKGVAVAIIDQPLLRDHPEFAGKVAAYEDVGCNSRISMHGPAVASLLVGKTVGTAPGAKLYYAAAPRWLRDAAYEARALDWLLAQNRKLAPVERIRVVSVSSSPGMTGDKNAGAWKEALGRAEAEGVVVLDCSEARVVVGPCWLEKPNRDDPASCTPGFPGIPPFPMPKRVLAPASPRTTAEQLHEGDASYIYWGRGGQSWAVPYAAGVLALGWQIRPELTGKEALDLLFQSAYRRDEQTRIINPREFVRAVREYRK